MELLLSMGVQLTLLSLLLSCTWYAIKKDRVFFFNYLLDLELIANLFLISQVMRILLFEFVYLMIRDWIIRWIFQYVMHWRVMNLRKTMATISEILPILIKIWRLGNEQFNFFNYSRIYFDSHQLKKENCIFQIDFKIV